MLIALFKLSTTYCQSDTTDLVPVAANLGKLLPVKVGDSTWYAMPKQRLANIANRIKNCQQDSSRLIEYKTGLVECNRLVGGQKEELAELRELVLNFDATESRLEGELAEMRINRQDCERAMEHINKQNKKLRTQNKLILIGGGGACLTLSGALLFCFLKK